MRRTGERVREAESTGLCTESENQVGMPHDPAAVSCCEGR